MPSAPGRSTAGGLLPAFGACAPNSAAPKYSCIGAAPEWKCTTIPRSAHAAQSGSYFGWW